jgi:hypothetical protein
MGSANSWPRRFGFLKVREGKMRHPALAHLHIPKGNIFFHDVIDSLSPYRRSSLPTAMSPKVTCVGKKMVGDLF